MTKKRLERTGVMLATPLDDKLLSTFPAANFVQPKLNGERCRAEWCPINNCHILFSSYGKRFRFLDHIELDLNKYFPEVSVDGELYFHGWSREKIHSIVSRKTTRHYDAERIEYHIFDAINNQKQVDRIDTIYRVRHEEGLDKSSLRLVETGFSHKEDIAEVAKSYLDAGYEGLILRNYFGFYEPKRSKNLAKFKPSKTDKYLIVKTLEEIDKDGYPKNTLGALRVTDHSGNEFNVGTGNALTKDGRAKLWRIRDSLPGRFAVVKHSLIYTVGGYPTCTSLVEIE